MSFETSKWTSTSPTPFGPAPGAGLSGVRRRQADINFQSGFALEAFGAEYTLPDQIIKAKGPFTVTQQPVLVGQIPAALIQIVFTDRGAINQGALDQGIFTAIQSKGFRMSASSRFYAVDVQWVWRKQAAADKYTKDLYFPVVSVPAGSAAAPFNGMVYSGSAISSAQMLDANFMPTAELLAKLPKQLWVYSFAVTNPNNQFTDADGAQVLTLLKADWSQTLPPLGASAYGYVTLLGADPSLFDGNVQPIVKKNNAWLWVIGAAIAAAYTHTPAPGAASIALARRLRG